jgi:hypothetical protein
VLIPSELNLCIQATVCKNLFGKWENRNFTGDNDIFDTNVANQALIKAPAAESPVFTPARDLSITLRHATAGLSGGARIARSRQCSRRGRANSEHTICKSECKDALASQPLFCDTRSID